MQRLAKRSSFTLVLVTMLSLVGCVADDDDAFRDAELDDLDEELEDLDEELDDDEGPVGGSDALSPGPRHGDPRPPGLRTVEDPVPHGPLAGADQLAHDRPHGDPDPDGPPLTAEDADDDDAED